MVRTLLMCFGMAHAHVRKWRAPRGREPSVREDLTRIIVDRSGSWQAARRGNWPGRSPATKAAWLLSDPAGRNTSEARAGLAWGSGSQAPIAQHTGHQCDRRRQLLGAD